MNAPEPKPPVRKPIGRIVVERGLVSEDQLHIALKEQTRSNLSLGKQLIALGFVTEATLRDALAAQVDTRPLVGVSNPESTLSKVDFPQPEEPNSAKISPRSMPKLTSLTATVSPNRLVTWSIRK